MSKLNISRETALCKYIPCEEGYLHHFSFLKMKSSNPIQLRNLIKDHILDRVPILVPPKKRNRRQRNEYEERPLIPRPTQRKPIEALESDYPTKSAGQEYTSRNLENQCSCVKGAACMQKPAPLQIEKLTNVMDHLAHILSKDSRQAIDSRNQREFFSRKNSDSILNKALPFIQNELIRKITMKQADEELWGIFCELIESKGRP
jgi:hypothetical protein